MPFRKFKNRVYIGSSREIVALHPTAWNLDVDEESLREFGALSTATMLKCGSGVRYMLKLICIL